MKRCGPQPALYILTIYKMTPFALLVPSLPFSCSLHSKQHSMCAQIQRKVTASFPASWLAWSGVDTIDACESTVQWPCYVQKAVFHNTLPQPMACTIFLYPLQQCSLNLGLSTQPNLSSLSGISALTPAIFSKQHVSMKIGGSLISILISKATVVSSPLGSWSLQLWAFARFTVSGMNYFLWS